MSEHDEGDDAKGRQLLTAVERLVAGNESIRALVAETQAGVKARRPLLKGEAVREATADALVKHFSSRAALAGGATALPSLIPGWGSLVAAVGGTVAELTLLLKWEVEMALCLTHLYGFDIDVPRERQLAFLMASVGTYDASGKSFFGDVVKAEGVAIWNYSPRLAGRLLVKVFAGVIALWLWRPALRAIPVLGIALGYGINKGLTQKVGVRCQRDLRTRSQLDDDDAPVEVTKKPARKKSKRAPAVAERDDLIN